MATPESTLATVISPVLLPDKTSRKKIRKFMAGELDASNTTASITETNHHQEDSTGSEKPRSSTSATTTTTQQDHRTTSTTTTRSSSSRSPSRGGGRVKRNNSAGSHRLSYVQIHSSNSIKGVNACDFTIDKLRFSSLGRLYGRDAEIHHLKSIISRKALKTSCSTNAGASDGNNCSSSGIKINDNQRNVANKEEDGDVSVAATPSTTTSGTAIASSSTTKKKVGFQDDTCDSLSFPVTHPNRKHLIMISGSAGCGKSVLALEAIPLVREQRGFFVSGKYDQIEPRKPFAAIATALQSLCEDLVLHKRAQGEAAAAAGGGGGIDDSIRTASSATTNKTTAATNNNKQTPTGCHRWTFKFTDFEEEMSKTFETEDIQLLNTIIPSLRKVIDLEYYSSDNESSGEFVAPTPQQEKEDPRSSAIQFHTESDNSPEHQHLEEGIKMYAFGGGPTNVTMEDYAEHKARIQSAFKRFIKLICAFGPLVLCLDDVQWIDSPSLELLESLIQDRESPALTIISSYRDDEIDDSHIWHTKILSLEEQARELNFKIHRIQLGNLAVDDICALLEDLISMSPDETRPLAECIHAKTQGNALYVKEFLLSLNRDELLTFEFRLMKWYCDVEEIRVNAKSTDNVVALLNDKMDKLPPMFSRLLPRVACLGCRFSFPLFEVVAEDCISDEEAEEALKLLASIRGGGE